MNKYLEKVCALLKAPVPPKSERAVKKHKLVHKPKLRKFTAKIGKSPGANTHHKKG